MLAVSSVAHQQDLIEAALQLIAVSPRCLREAVMKKPARGSGGEGGIRTPDTVARTPHFECGAFNHSATSPEGPRLLHLGARAF
jgi:hypothetical protein